MQEESPSHLAAETQADSKVERGHLGDSAIVTKLRTVLERYDSWSLPHLGDPRALKTSQRGENLAYVLAIKQERQARVLAALPEIAPQLAALLDPQVHPFASVLELDRWWVDTALQLKLIPPVAGTLTSRLFSKRFYAANQVLAEAHWFDWPDNPLVASLDSLLRDIGLIVGDAIVLRRPDFRWTVNENAKEKKEPGLTWGHVVVLREATEHWAQQAFDLMGLARWSYADLYGRKRMKLNYHAVEVLGGEWRGTFVGWTAVDVINGGFTEDHYPHGRDGPAVSGRWAG